MKNTSSDYSRAFASPRRCLLLSGSAIVLAAMTAPAYGQQETDPGAHFALEEIMVTARKKEESLERVPVAITAFSGQSMTERGLSDISQIADFTPNMQFDFSAPISGSSNAASIFIRGVGQIDFLMTIDPGVGVYVDGVYLSRSMGSVLDLLDIDRIEVLRGPQGTLFGKNTIGGAINVTTKRPSNEFEGVAELTVGRFNQIDVKASLNIPLVPDKLALRMSGATQNKDGWAKRADGVELGNKNADSLRGSLLWNVSDNLDALLNVDWSQANEGSPVSTLLAVNPAAQLGGLYNFFVATPPDFYDGRYIHGAPKTGQAVSQGTDPSGSKYDIIGSSLTLEWNLDAFDVKSISSYRHMEVEFGNDFDHSPHSIISTYTWIKHEQVSQEINLSGKMLDNRLEWLLGGYYFHETGDNDTQVPIVPGLFQNPGLLAFAQNPPPGVDPAQLMGLYSAGASAAGLNTVNNTSYAAYTHLNYHLTDQLTGSVGLRYTRDKKKAENGSVFKDLVDAFGGVILPGFYVLQEHKSNNTFDDWSPSVSLQYQWTDDVMTYLSFSKGFKSGGVSERYRLPRPAPVSFQPETVKSYEAGFKTNLFDNRLRLNGAAFFSNYDNIQVSTIRDVEPLTFNAAKAEIKGVELEFTAIPVDNLRINGGMGYVDARYTELDPGVLINLDSMFVNTPEWSASIAAEYSIGLGNNSELNLHTDYSYRSRIANDAVNTPELIQSGYGLWGVGATYRHGDSGLSLTLFGRNLTDKRYVVTGWSEWNSVGFIEAVWGRPREWGGTLRYEF